MTLTFGSHKASCTHLVDCIYQFLYHRLQCSIVLTFSHTKAYGTKFDFAVKKVKVNPGASFEQS